MDSQLAIYARLAERRKERYRFDFAAAEEKWIFSLQAVIDRVEADLPGVNGAHLEGLIDFLSKPIDYAHERIVNRLQEQYQADIRKIREECGL